MTVSGPLSAALTMNGLVWAARSDTEVGERVRFRGTNETVETANRLVSNVLVAFTWTVALVGIPSGAVYRPPGEIAPAPWRLQVTAVLTIFEIRAVNCLVCPTVKVLFDGVIERSSGTSRMVATTERLGSMELVTITRAVDSAGMPLGAVYKPADVTVPIPAGSTLQVALPLAPFCTREVNCWVSLTPIVTEDGETVRLRGCSTTVATATRPGSTELLAVTRTSTSLAIETGAV